MKLLFSILFLSVPFLVGAQVPVVNSFSPTRGGMGTNVVIKGANFTGTTNVSFGGTPAASFIVDSSGGITAIVGQGSPGFVKVTTPAGADSLAGFIVPTIKTFSPSTGTIGTVVTIKGTNFVNVFDVNFGGTSSTSLSVLSDTVITAVVPKASSGDVSVSTIEGTATKQGFIYTGPPSITNFSPASGAVNTPITITGTGFNTSSLTSNIVYFGTVRGQVTAVTPTTLTVLAPAGADFQPIKVISNSFTAYSIHPFVTTFMSNGLPLSNSSFAIHRVNYYSDYFNVSDFNADTKPDIVMPFSSSGISSYKNISSGYLPEFLFQNSNNSSSLSPSGITSGFLDADGLPDIAVSNSSNTVSLFKNVSTASNITFNTGTTLTTGTSPRSPVIIDLDGDGKSEIIVANYNSNTISVFKNSCNNCSSPVFGPKADYTTGINPYSVSAGDIDGDGMPDIIVTNEGSATISVFRNSSIFNTIIISPKIDFTASATVRGLAIIDMDNDGMLDLITSSPSSGEISVYKNNSTPGTISFLPRTNYYGGRTPWNISAGDVDGDSKPDIIVSKFSYDTLTILKNNSTTGNIIIAAKMDYNVSGLASASSIVCDMNGDGKSDIVGTGYIYRNKIDVAPVLTAFSPSMITPSDTLRILGRNLSGASGVSIGGFSASSFTIISDTIILAVPLIGASGNITVTNPYGADSITGITVSVIPVINSFSPSNGPVGTSVEIRGAGFSPLLNENIVYFGAVKATVTGANDSTINVVVPPGASFQPITVVIPTKKLLANSTRPFIVTFPGAGSSFTSSSFASRINFIRDTLTYKLLQGDMNGDGKPDLITARKLFDTPTYFSTHTNTSVPGSISFVQSGNNLSLHNPRDYVISDMNGDGKLDIITGNYADVNILSVYLNNSVNGVMSFGSAYDINRVITAAEDLLIADFDKDGRNDIIQKDAGVSRNRILRNISNFQGLSFGSITTFSDNGSYFTSGDIDGDGKRDFISSQLVRVHRNTSILGNIGFASPTSLQSISSAVSNLNVADFDNDGKLDILFTNITSNKYSFFRNTSSPGNISSAAQVDSPFIKPGIVALGDLDGDGKVDVVISKDGTDSIAVIKNISNPGQIQFADKVYFRTGWVPDQLILSDVDIDGKLDIVTLNRQGCCGTTKNFSVLRNRIGDPQIVGLCSNGNTSFSSNISGASYQWQLDAGSGYNNISDNASYTGTTSPNLQISNVPSNWYGNKYRCYVNGIYSYEFSLFFTNTWTGTSGNAWENPANWSCGSVPDQNTDVIINNGSITINASTTIRSLSINSNANLTVASGVILTVLH